VTAKARCHARRSAAAERLGEGFVHPLLADRRRCSVHRGAVVDAHTVITHADFVGDFTSGGPTRSRSC
jgi:hypothetical protein